MKKIIIALLMIAGLGVSVTASADDAPTGVLPGQVIDNTAMCTLLTEGVTLTLSKNVRAAYNCATVDNSIRIATCHAAGSIKATSMQCAIVGYDATGKPIYNNTGCQGQTPTDVYQIASARVYETMSKGGSAAPADLGHTCTADPTDAPIMTP